MTFSQIADFFSQVKASGALQLQSRSRALDVSWRSPLFSLALASTLAMGVAGCGSGGYPGGGIASLSESTLVLDAGQSSDITATASNNVQIAWSFGGSACSGSACGTLSANSGAQVTYTAPLAITSSMTLNLVASVPGTKNQQTVQITVNPDPQLAATLLPGTVGASYSAQIVASGGTAPAMLSIASGTIPSGLAFSASTGKISGTPTTVGTWTFVVQLKDSSATPDIVTAKESITITAAALKITSVLAPGTIGLPYTSTIAATGGTPPYTCSIASALPAGLILNGCVISGTPNAPGSFTVVVSVTDSGNPAQTASATQTIVIGSDPLTLTTSTLPGGTVGVPYSAAIGVAGGASPYSCAITGGTLPAGLSLSGCIVAGTPSTSGTSQLTVKVIDSSNPAQMFNGPESITISSSALTLTSTLSDGTVGIPYTSTITAIGGDSPYTCSITGALPAGLKLSGCTVSGTPTVPGASTVTVTVTDASKPVKTGSGAQTIVIAPVGQLSLNANLPSAIVGVAYTYALHAVGGTAPYDYALSAGALPPGIALQADGTITGTPTAPGASSFTVNVTDSASTPATASAALLLPVNYAQTTSDAELKGPYAFLFQGYDDVVAGVLAYQTATVGSFTADGIGGLSAGELDANHQTSNPDGTTVPTRLFLGTYVLNADNRGMITITSLNTDGTTDRTFTYAVSVKAPVPPATATTRGSLIEFDDNNLVGTRGSGSLLAQTPDQFASGLNGSYAFGLSGDTPCLVSCTVGIGSGPVAAVGQFTTDGTSALTSGSSDVNIATMSFANAPLTGSYEAADANGRIQLAMTNTSVSDGLYPTNFAVYVVNANESFILSTDKHSAYDLLAGTAQLQSTSSFSNEDMSGPFIGYENAQTNPGLLGATLESVLNYSSATVFRASGDGSGVCATTNVDSGGLTSLVDNLTGLANGNKNNLLNALIGSYGATGESSCSVSSSGRGQLNYPDHSGAVSLLLELLGLSTSSPSPRVFYLAAPGSGYLLETGYAGLGHLEQQTGSPFSLATLDGTYVDETVAASSLASINKSGYFKADGAGNVTYTQDENVGLGTINILDLGVAGTTSYHLSDPNANVPAATAGRYVLGDSTTVLYAISPNKFVMIDTSPTSTAPSVSLLY